jgi:hypothetical protein
MLCEAEQLSCGTDSLSSVFTDVEEEDETCSTDSDAPSVEQSGAADKEETEPFSISSVLSVIDVSVPLASRRRQMAQAAAQELSADPTAELVREYTKDWSSPAARQWYASQLHFVAAESTVGEGEVAEEVSLTGGDEETSTLGVDQTAEDEVHIPLPVGLGKHQYFQQPIAIDSVPSSGSEGEVENDEEDEESAKEPMVPDVVVQQPTKIIHIAKRRRSNKSSCLFFKIV